MTAAPDLLDVLLRGTDAELDLARRAVEATADRGDAAAVAECDRALRDGTGHLERDADGGYDLVVGDRTWRAGRFTIPTLDALTAAARPTGAEPGRATLSVLLGADLLTDIGALQAHAGIGTLFQVASQLNCLESPHTSIVPVPEYLHDPTQGPRAAVSAFPGALLRHHAAPDGSGGTFVQTDERQVNLLADALPPDHARVVGGYLRPRDVLRPEDAACALEEHHGSIRIGVHDDAEVALGASWRGSDPAGTRIAQVCTSTLAAGLYGDGRPLDGPFLEISRSLLRAAYLGTILAAAVTGRRRVLLTLIGGGVFGNPHPLIVEAIDWALQAYDRVGAGALDVVLNARDLEADVDLGALAGLCGDRGGILRRVG